MKKYSILALALVLCVTGLTGCRKNKRLADGTIPTTAATATTHPVTTPSTAATTVPATTETRPMDTTMSTQDSANDPTAPSGRSRSRATTPGVG